MPGRRDWHEATVWRSNRSTRVSKFAKIYTGRVRTFQRWRIEVDSIGAARRVHVAEITHPIGWQLQVGLDEIDVDGQTWVVKELNRRHAICTITKTRDRNDDTS